MRTGNFAVFPSGGSDGRRSRDLTIFSDNPSVKAPCEQENFREMPGNPERVPLSVIMVMVLTRGQNVGKEEGTSPTY